MSTTKELVDHLEGWLALFAPDDHVNWKEHGQMFAKAADRLEALEDENKRLKDALQFYAAAAAYDLDEDEFGNRARAALLKGKS